MKIDQDLRLAIRAAEKTHRLANQDSWQAKQARNQAAVAAFLQAKPTAAKVIRAAAAKIKRLKAAIERHATQIALVGLRSDHSEPPGFALSDEARFTKAGGKLPALPGRWSADGVIAQLAAAEPAEAKNILKRIGINWT